MSRRLASYTDEEFIAGLRKAVEERGADYVNHPDSRGLCRYTVNGKPSCIIGTAIYHMKGSVFRGSNGSAHVVLYNYFPKLSTRVRHAASRAQKIQDDSKPWGEALAAFEEFLAEKSTPR